MSVTGTRTHYRLWPALLLAAGGIAGAVTVLGVAHDPAGPESCGSGEQWVQVGPGADSPLDGPAAMVGNPAALAADDDPDLATDATTGGAARPVANHLGHPTADDPSLNACVDLDELPSYPLPPSDPRS